jgi:indole-3-glycerol phosphate synthase
LPVLCKDFILEEYQVYHARYRGADAILLIVALLEKEMLLSCMEAANDQGLDCLVEVHDDTELRVAIDIGASIIGVNNRNLKDFSVSLETSERLAPSIPDGTIKVSESGIFTRPDVERLTKAGFGAFLVGEALVKSESPDRLIRTLRRS